MKLRLQDFKLRHFEECLDSSAELSKGYGNIKLKNQGRYIVFLKYMLERGNIELMRIAELLLIQQYALNIPVFCMLQDPL